MSNKIIKYSMVLITRPQHQAQALTTAIENAGSKVILFPTIEIQATNQLNLKKLIHQFNTFAIAIFVSANAVNQVAPYLQQQPFDNKIIAIGPGTAKTLRHYYLPVHAIPTKFSSEGILELPLLKNIRQKKIVLFCGENSRPYLKTELQQRKALVTEAICYRRICPNINDQQRQILKTQPIDALVLTSKESLQNLVALLPSELKRLRQLPIIVISQEMAVLAKQYGFCQVIIANNPTNEAIMQVLMYNQYD